MLACSRIGAIHSVVFGGFASEELGRRIQHAEVRYNSLVSERPRASVQNISFANWKRIPRVSGYFGLHDFMKMYQVSSPAKIQLPLSFSTGKTKWQHNWQLRFLDYDFPRVCLNEKCKRGKSNRKRL